MTPVQGGARADLALSPKGKIGPSLSISWGQTASSSALWRVDVYVRTDEGKVFLGSVIPSPPSVGGHPSRIVAIATCPGARGWDVELEGPIGESAEIGLACSECCEGLPGLVNLDTFGRPLEAGAQRVQRVQPLAIFQQLTPGPGALWRATGFQTSGGAAFVQLHDCVGQPAALASPIDSIPVANGAGWVWSMPTAQPLRFQTGIVFALSTTPVTFTAGAAALSAVGWVDG